MGLLDWLFPPPEKKVAKARQLFAAGKPDDARALLLGVDGSEAEQLYAEISRALEEEEEAAEAGPEEPLSGPMISLFPMLRDGTQRIAAGGSLVTLNAPAVDQDCGPALEDPLAVAEAVLASLGPAPLEGGRHFAFVEAARLLGLRGRPLAACKDPRRRALAQLAWATSPEAAAQVIGAASGGERAPLCGLLDALFARRHPETVATLLEQHGAEPGLVLMETLGARDPDRCHDLLSRAEPAGWRAALALEALLAAMDAGKPAAGLERLWLEDGKGEPEQFRMGELRRQSRLDLDAALAAYQDLRQETGDISAEASEAVFARLARRDPAGALALVASAEPSGFDDLPRLLGCFLGGAEVGPLFDRYLEQLDAHAYRPFQHFDQLLDLGLRLGERSRVGAALDRAGAKGWQVAACARGGLRWLARVRPEAVADLLSECRCSRPPGVVAGRDASDGGLHVGHVVFRPDWLRFESPRAVDTLTVLAALGDEAPDWGTARVGPA